MKTRVEFLRPDEAAKQLSLWLAYLLGLIVAIPTLAAGTWTPLAHTAPGSVGLLLLLPDGSVMAANNPAGPLGAFFGNRWFRLRPDSHGSYINGTWTEQAPMRYTRLFYASTVLRDGRVMVAGGEYGTGGSTVEVYNPRTDIWTEVPVPEGLIDPLNPTDPFDLSNGGFRDPCSKILPDGRVMIAPVKPAFSRYTVIFDPNGNTLSMGPRYFGSQNEASWVKLPDDSILTVAKQSQNSERFLPSQNQWVIDANVPVPLYDPFGSELGPAFLLPNGKAIFFGATGKTALYTPSGDDNPGAWEAGPDIPNNQGMPDASGAMMVNGKILCVVAPIPVSTTEIFIEPASFYEYDFSDGPVGSFTRVASPTGGLTDSIPSYRTCMLALPDGTVLYSHYHQGDLFYDVYGSQLYVYDPSGSPLAAGKPTIASISLNGNGSFHLVGTGLNGISEGAAYGDDAQMDSNYPLVRLRDGSSVTYARTFNWSSTGVQTGSKLVSTEFSVEDVVPGAYSLVVVANGIASAPVSFSGPTWVDFDYSGFLELGSYSLPWNTLAEGVGAVSEGGLILIKPGVSSETMTISKAMTIQSVGGSAVVGR